MPTVLDFAPTAEGPPNPKRWTRAELRSFIDAGFTDLERYELFGGELIDKMGKNRPHVTVVRRAVRWLNTVEPDHWLSDGPINLRSVDNPTYRPEPDAVLLARPFEVFSDRDPDPPRSLSLSRSPTPRSPSTSARKHISTPKPASPNTGCSTSPADASSSIATPAPNATPPFSPSPNTNPSPRLPRRTTPSPPPHFCHKL